MWNWEWVEDADIGSDSEASSRDEPEPPAVDTEKEEEEAEDHGVPAITHSVVFKCIGATKEMRYHELLALANRQQEMVKLLQLSYRKNLEILLIRMLLHSCAKLIQTGKELAT